MPTPFYSSHTDCSRNNVSIAGAITAWPPSPNDDLHRMRSTELHDIISISARLPTDAVILLLGIHAFDAAELARKVPGVSAVAATPHVFGYGSPMSLLRCDFVLGEIPTSLTAPSLIAIDTPFQRSADYQLSYRALRCAYPHATLYLTSTDATVDREHGEPLAPEGGEGLRDVRWPGFMLPGWFSGIKFAMYGDERDRHSFVRSWLLTAQATSLGWVAASRPSGLVSLTPDGSSGVSRMHKLCNGPAALDEHRMLHDCTDSFAPRSPSPLSSLTRVPPPPPPPARPRAVRSNPIEFFRDVWSGFVADREAALARLVPRNARVLDFGCAIEHLGVTLLSVGRNITYCPADVIPRNDPFVAMVSPPSLGTSLGTSLWYHVSSTIRLP